MGARQAVLVAGLAHTYPRGQSDCVVEFGGQKLPVLHASFCVGSAHT